MAEIDACDILIAETSEKSIGIGVEAGFARAKGKVVIYMRQHDREHSTTVAGISDFQLIYKDNLDLKQQLFTLLNHIKRPKP
jgi:nucleoside 2-deoxyribosyltransferase